VARFLSEAISFDCHEQAVMGDLIIGKVTKREQSFKNQ
jgi:hypothetical protein